MQGKYNTSAAKKLYDGNVQHYNSLMTTTWTSQTPSNSSASPQVPAYASSSSVWDGNGIYAEKWIMDRNIGAQSPDNSSIENPDEAFGMYYQYGRKDPFSYKPIYDIEGNSIPTRWTPIKDSGSIQLGINNPNTFYTTSGTAKWAGTSASDNAWFNPDWNNSGYARGDKTLFDPCPPGWCIPVHEVFYFAVKTATNNRLKDGEAVSSTHACLEIYVNINNTTNSPYIVDPLRGFFDLVNTSDDDLHARFPLAGYIMGDGSAAGTITGITSANTTYNAAISNGQIRGCVWTLEHNKDGSGRLLQVQPTTIHPISSAAVYNEYPVPINGRYYNIHFVGASIRNWVSSRGHNIRCIQVP